MGGVKTSFGYTDGSEIDGSEMINITTSWEYKLSLVVVDYPPQYMRSFLIDLTERLSAGDWCEISDLNIVLLSDIATFSNGTKARIGKVTGIVWVAGWVWRLFSELVCDQKRQYSRYAYGRRRKGVCFYFLCWKDTQELSHKLIVWQFPDSCIQCN